MLRDELSQIAELARQYNLMVISDEVYGRLIYGCRNLIIYRLLNYLKIRDIIC